MGRSWAHQKNLIERWVLLPEVPAKRKGLAYVKLQDTSNGIITDLPH